MADKQATRLAYGEALAELGEKNEKIVAFDADVSTCTMSVYFGDKFPERFHNCGIAEENMIGMAAGMSTFGYVPFVHAFAMFMAGRGYDQIRNSVCYPNLNVKCVGTHAGLSVGEDGATHQCIEDIALMRAIPNMTVICPADGYESAAAAKAVAEYEGPVYLRLGRLALENVTDVEGYEFKIGKAVELAHGNDVCIIATGLMVGEAVRAAEMLKEYGISARVLDMHTIKPLDVEAVVRAAKETGCIVTAEEHNVLGGLGGAVCEVTSDKCPVPVVRVGVKDCFGRSGNALDLLKLYHLQADDVVAAARDAVTRKTK